MRAGSTRPARLKTSSRPIGAARTSCARSAPRSTRAAPPRPPPGRRARRARSAPSSPPRPRSRPAPRSAAARRPISCSPALRTGLGLALLYLILSPKGTKGLSGALNGVSSFVNLLIAPVDPLGGGGRRAPTSAAGVPILQPGETKAHFDKRLGDYLKGRAQTPARPTSGAGVLGAPNLGGFPQTVTGKSPTSSVITDRQSGGHL
jgi:hypothetical protein